jgi:hypothetical protein
LPNLHRGWGFLNLKKISKSQRNEAKTVVSISGRKTACVKPRVLFSALKDKKQRKEEAN